MRSREQLRHVSEEPAVNVRAMLPLRSVQDHVQSPLIMIAKTFGELVERDWAND